MRAITASMISAVALLTACTSAVETSNGYQAEGHPVRHEMLAPAGCELDVTQITDSRPDPSVMGRLGPRIVKAPSNPQQWIRNLLAGLNVYGIEVQFAAPPSPPQLSAAVVLRTAWVSSIATAKTGNVVLSVRYERPGGLVKETLYRGAESDVNWNSSSDEIQGMIDSALDQIVDAIGRDVSELCRQAIAD